MARETEQNIVEAVEFGDGVIGVKSGIDVAPDRGLGGTVCGRDLDFW